MSNWTDDAINTAPTETPATSWWVGLERGAFSMTRAKEQPRMETSKYGRTSTLVTGPSERTGYERILEQRTKAKTVKTAYAEAAA
jgi:hypothetical protein